MDKMCLEDEILLHRLVVPQDILQEVANPNRIFFVTDDRDDPSSYNGETDGNGQSSSQTSSVQFCTLCGKNFKSKRCLLLHSLQHRVGRPVVCSVCRKTFKHKAHLSMHMTRHKACSCSQCGHSFADRERLDFHRKSHRSKQLCTICNKLFSCIKSLEIHKLSHSGKAPYTCKLCAKKFFYKHSLTSHTCNQASTPKESRFTCDVCGKSYRFRSEVERHRKHHNSVKDWLCRVCGKIYPLQSTLKTHLKTHAAQKLFQCALCAAGFMKKALLEKHIGRTHLHLSSTVLCHRCPKMFYDDSDLKFHMTIHNKVKE